MGTPEDVIAEEHFTPPEEKDVKHYPECEKMAKCHDKSWVCGEFLEWLRDQGYVFARYVKDQVHVCTRDESMYCDVRFGDICQAPYRDCPDMRVEESGREHLEAEHFQIEDVLARFFEIDLKKVEAEKQEMLADMRKNMSSQGAAAG